MRLENISSIAQKNCVAFASRMLGGTAQTQPIWNLALKSRSTRSSWICGLTLPFSPALLADHVDNRWVEQTGQAVGATIDSPTARWRGSCFGSAWARVSRSSNASSALRSMRFERVMMLAMPDIVGKAGGGQIVG